MEFTELVTRLELIGNDAAAAQQLGQALTARMRYPAQVAVEFLGTGEREAEQKGMALLDSLPEVGLGVVAESLGRGSTAADVWKVRMLADELAALREHAAKALLPLLDRREPAPGELGAPAGVRVCDVAYEMLNRFLRRKGAANFLALPSKEKNEAIAELKGSDEMLELL